MIMIILNRYELPDNTQLAIVTFNNESRVEHQLATLTRFNMKIIIIKMVMIMKMTKTLIIQMTACMMPISMLDFQLKGEDATG